MPPDKRFPKKGHVKQSFSIASVSYARAIQRLAVVLSISAQNSEKLKGKTPLIYRSIENA